MSGRPRRGRSRKRHHAAATHVGRVWSAAARPLPPLAADGACVCADRVRRTGPAPCHARLAVQGGTSGGARTPVSAALPQAGNGPPLSPRRGMGSRRGPRVVATRHPGGSGLVGSVPAGRGRRRMGGIHQGPLPSQWPSTRLPADRPQSSTATLGRGWAGPRGSPDGHTRPTRAGTGGCGCCVGSVRGAASCRGCSFGQHPPLPSCFRTPAPARRGQHPTR